MGHLSDTLLGSLLGALTTLGGALLIYRTTRGRDRETATLSQQQLADARRDKDITLIIDTLQEQVRWLTGENDRLQRRVAELERAQRGIPD